MPLDREPEIHAGPQPPPRAPAIIDKALVEPFPFRYSKVVALGEIVSVQTFFSEDKTDIYRESTFRISEILKPGGRALKVGDSLGILSKGGSLRLPNGRIVTSEYRGDGSPLARGHYLLFLHERSDVPRFGVVTAWELRSEQVLPTSVACTPEEQEELTSLGSQLFLARARSTVH